MGKSIRKIRILGKGSGTWNVDLARELSVLNNSLYRQGMMYDIANVSMSSDQDFRVKFSTAPNTWAMHQGWKMAFKNFLNGNKERIDDSTFQTIQKLSKYFDFRVGLYKDSTAPRGSEADGKITAGRGVNSMAVSADGVAFAINEWNLTQFESLDADDSVSDGDKFTAHLVGPHDYTSGSSRPYDSVSTLQAYHETLLRRGQVADGDDDGDGDVSDDLSIETGVWANYHEDEASSVEDAVEHLLDDYNEPPFDGDNFVGMLDTHIMCERELHLDPSGSVGGQLVGGGFTAFAGLIDIVTTDLDAGHEWAVEFELVPGTYKGVSATPIGKPVLTPKKEWAVR